MALARRQYSPLILALLLTLSLILLSLHLREGPLPLPILNRGLVTAITTLQGLVTTSKGKLTSFWYKYLDLIAVREENRRLKDEVERLRFELSRLQEGINEERRLRQLLELKEAVPFKATAAKVIARDPTSYFKALWIDKGREDGVIPGLAAMTWGGVVGRVIEAFPNSSKVILLIDPNSAIDALISRTRDPGIVYGRVGGGLIMRYLPLSATLAPGDQAISSGLGGVYPKGLFIGEVSKVRRHSSGIYLEAEVIPRVDFDRLEEVLIIRGY